MRITKPASADPGVPRLVSHSPTLRRQAAAGRVTLTL